MTCPKCGATMKSLTTIDDNWRVYRCPMCKHEKLTHIRHKRRGKNG